jgi:hypothetical protein
MLDALTKLSYSPEGLAGIEPATFQSEVTADYATSRRAY